MWVFTGREIVNVKDAVRIALREGKFTEQKNVSFTVFAFFPSCDAIELADVYLDCYKIDGVDASNYKNNLLVEAGTQVCKDECTKCIQALNMALHDGLSYCDISGTYQDSIFLRPDGTMRREKIY